MKIEWDKVVNGTIQTLITTIIVGAAIVVWNGATSVDKKVNAATATLGQTIDYTKKAVELVQTELIQIKNQNSNLVEAINNLKLDQSNETKTATIPQGLPSFPFKWNSPSNQFLFEMAEGFHPRHHSINVSQIPPVEKDYIQKQLPPVPSTNKD